MARPASEIGIVSGRYFRTVRFDISAKQPSSHEEALCSPLLTKRGGIQKRSMELACALHPVRWPISSCWQGAPFVKCSVPALDKGRPLPNGVCHFVDSLCLRSWLALRTL